MLFADYIKSINSKAEIFLTMLWVINGLIYGFFTALYTLVNQKYKMNGYLLGIWRGFGISVIFLPFLLYNFPWPQTSYHWSMLIIQGLCIGYYDSHLFFASANYGAGSTSRVMSLATLITCVSWWILTPSGFEALLADGSVFITLILILFGFSLSCWYMFKDKISRDVFDYMLLVILALSIMSIITKELAVHGSTVWPAITYYLVIPTFVSGCYNTLFYVATEKPGFVGFFKNVFSKKAVGVGLYIVSFSTALITAKNIALRLAPNPGYVMALVLTAPIFVFLLNKYNKIPDNVSVKAGFSMIFFLVLLVILVNGNFGVVD